VFVHPKQNNILKPNINAVKQFFIILILIGLLRLNIAKRGFAKPMAIRIKNTVKSVVAINKFLKKVLNTATTIR